MNIPVKLITFIAVFNILFLIIVLLLMNFWGLERGEGISIIAGWGITTFNFGGALFFIYRGYKKNAKSFIQLILGGMTFRMMLTLLMVIICLKTLEINQNSFIFSIFIFYLLYLIVEILHLNSIKE
jgi:hypothetical protein